jgi:hypothetical protein
LVPEANWDELMKKLDGVSEAYLNAKRQLDERERLLTERDANVQVQQDEAQKREASLKNSEHELNLQIKKVATEKEELELERTEADGIREALLEREQAVSAKERAALKGFLAEREEALEELNDAHQEALKALSKKHADLLRNVQKLQTSLEEAQQKHLQDLVDREAAHAKSLKNLTAEHDSALRKRERDLDARAEQLRTDKTELVRDKQDASWAQEDAEELRQHVEEHIEKRVNARLDEHKEELARVEKAKQRLSDRCGDLEGELEKRRENERRMQHLSPNEVQDRIDGYQRRIDELQDELANRPSTEDSDDLGRLRDDEKRWMDERRTLREDLRRVKRQLDTQNIAVDEVEILRDRNEALKANQTLLKAALDDLREDIDERLDKHRDQPVFPELMRMDGDVACQELPPLFFAPSSGSGLDLKQFAQDLRHRVGKAPDSKQPDLFYRMEDIRAFLGGLAMSRLHLLQGISGIGKSSLPRRFATAVGGTCETISVQAGWRDRNDLLGYFNAFERRYYESGFVQALYKAQTPAYKDRIVIVLLDEMNLSHPEQYAADVLDVLERREEATRRFELMSAQQPGATPRHIEGGRFLRLPDNVWFVGTANHDETTKDFADKTYDRSFVLELPARPERFKLKSRVSPRAPISLGMVLDAFNAAAQTYVKEGEQAMGWLTGTLAKPMAEHFGIGFGGRLERQAARFVPVVCAAGGDIGEALDQMICMRLLRRIKGRHDLMPEDLQEVLDLLQNQWISTSHPAVASVSLVRRELKRLGADA